MTPAYQVTIDGNVINFGGRLVSIAITNETPDRFVAETSDSCEIVLQDTQTPRLALPRRGVEMQVSLGYAGQPLVNKGTFVVDEVEIAGPPDQLIIRAQSNPKSPHDELYSSLSTTKNRSFPAPLTIQQLVTQIAKDNNLTAVVGSSLASTQLVQVDQTNEGDIDVLIRMALIFDAVVKVQGGKLIFTARGLGQSATGQAMPTITVTKGGPGVTVPAGQIVLTKWSVRLSDFIAFQTVIAVWRDTAGAQDVEVQAGNGGAPTLRLVNPYPNAATALAAANSALLACDRRVADVNVAFPGVPTATAEGMLVITGVRDGADDSWYINKVTHRIDAAGYTTEVAAGRLSVDAVEEDESDTD